MEIGVAVRAESVEILSELSRATTAYHEAAPDILEAARQQYLEALQKFNNMICSAESRSS